MQLLGEEKYVMQFPDKSFLKLGFFHGFVSIGNDFVVGKTHDLKEARKFSSEVEAQRVAYDLNIVEAYELKEIEIIIKLK